MIGRAAVVGIDPSDPDNEMTVVHCKTVDETAAAVANLMLQGMPYLHVDNLAVLETAQNTP